MRIPTNITKGTDSAQEVAKTGAPQEAKRTKKGGKVAPSETERTEKVEVSQKARDTAAAKSIAKSAPDIDNAKIERLRQSVQNGTYKVDADKVADRMVDEHLQSMY